MRGPTATVGTASRAATVFLGFETACTIAPTAIRPWMVKYNHSRGWFNRRIDNGTFTEEKKLGEMKIYLHRSQIERYMREHPEEEGQ